MTTYGVHETGRWEILGFDVGEAETEAFWREFLKSLIARGLSGVQLVTSNAHEELKAAIARLLGCPCSAAASLSSGIASATPARTSTAAGRPDSARSSRPTRADQARQRLGEAIAALAERLPKVAAMLTDSEEDILAFYVFPQPHWSKLRSTNPLVRFNKEIGRRTDVVGTFPDDRSLIRLVGMLRLEQNDEWLVGRRYLSAAAMEPLREKRLHRCQTIYHEEVRELTAI